MDIILNMYDKKSHEIKNIRYTVLKNGENVWFVAVVSCAWPPVAIIIHDSKYGATCVLIANTYTAKQLQTLNMKTLCISFHFCLLDVHRRVVIYQHTPMREH